MTQAFVLGAGFSMAVDYLRMPSTEQLGAEAIELLRAIHHSRAVAHSDICDGLSCDYPTLVEGRPPGGSFEVWLSRLAEPQPYRLEHENMIAAGLYHQLASAVADCIRGATERSCEQSPATEPSWFEPILREWHERRADVVTFNYDTLIEARYDALGSTEHGGSFDHGDLNDLMPLAGVIDGGGAGARPSSFRYWKLHGSIHWYWDPITRSADSMVQVDLPARWRGSAHATDPAELVPGRRPIVVPPTASKTGFFDNPVIRHIWRQAFEAIRRADRVILIGYSLPVYDLLVGSLLDEAVRRRGRIPATVVDISPEPVKARLAALGYDVTHTFEDVDEFVSHYSSESDS